MTVEGSYASLQSDQASRDLNPCGIEPQPFYPSQLF